MNNTNIANSPNQSYKTPIQEPSPKPNDNRLLFIIFSIFFIVTAASFIVIYTTQKDNILLPQAIPITQELSPTTIQITQPSPIIDINQTKDWITYSDSDLKISFKHPNTWKITKDISVPADYNPEDKTRSFLAFWTEGPAQQAFDSRLDIYNNKTIAAVSNENPFISSDFSKIIKNEILNLNNNNWTKLTISTKVAATPNEDYIHYTYLIQKNNNTYEFGVSSNISSIAELFLSTLIFN